MRRAFGLMVLLALVACGSPESKEEAAAAPKPASKRQQLIQRMVWGNPEVPARDRRADSMTCRERAGTEGLPLFLLQQWTKCMIELGWELEKPRGA